MFSSSGFVNFQTRNIDAASKIPSKGVSVLRKGLVAKLCLGG